MFVKLLKYFCVCLILTGFPTLISQPIPNRPGKLEVFDITEGFLSPRNIMLSEVCTGIEYIRLETKPDFFIKRFDIVEIGRKFIVIADTRDYQAFLFHRDGRFVKHLGKIGKGPGEFVSCYNVSLSPDETSVAIFDASRQRVIVYQTGSSNYQEVTINGFANEVVFGSDTHLLVSYNYPASVTNSNFQFAWIDLAHNDQNSFAQVPESIRSRVISKYP
ncbi:MAG: hypothetical protein A2X22_03140 [Bacteroidetes bacterium GWF2_49_14]|nr:MAG: hypothetical protein A2X22_03140 [Bacteroidetes bacterium GWF2_49_14]HBB93039.1 hypothetical protein [Bacteroidales bacterium]